MKISEMASTCSSSFSRGMKKDQKQMALIKKYRKLKGRNSGELFELELKKAFEL